MKGDVSQPRSKAARRRWWNRGTKGSKLESGSHAIDEPKTPNAPESSNTAKANAVSIQRPPKASIPTDSMSSPAPQTQEKVPAKAAPETSTKGPPILERAQKALDKAATRLKGLLPEDILKNEQVKMDSIPGSADVSSLAENIGSVVDLLMREGSDDDTDTLAVQHLIKGWVKKALPFIHSGLKAAKVRWPFLRRKSLM
jgi:hypothetical protein